MASIISTHLCKSLEIDVPILAAPMGFLTGPDLAAAVSNAGGLGMMSFTANPPSLLREEIRRLRVAHPVYKQKVLAANETQTVRTSLFGFGWPNAPHRTLRTPFVERWLADETRGSEQRPDEPRIGETKIAGQSVPLLRFMGFPPTPDASGDLDSMNYLAGQGVGLVKHISPPRKLFETS